MSERTTAEIRQEIAAERQRLDENLTALERELLSGVPPLLAVGGATVAAVVFLTVRRRRSRKKPTSVALIWNLK
jgi:hypothetical protein